MGIPGLGNPEEPWYWDLTQRGYTEGKVKDLSTREEPEMSGLGPVGHRSDIIFPALR